MKILSIVIPVLTVVAVFLLDSTINRKYFPWKFQPDAALLHSNACGDNNRSVLELCLEALQDGIWTEPLKKNCSAVLPTAVAACDSEARRAWVWKNLDCGQRAMPIKEAFSNKVVAFVGDSNTRQLHNYYVTLVNGSEAAKASRMWFPQHFLPWNTTVILKWGNLARLVNSTLSKWMQEDFYPDIVIACSSMWHLYLEKNLTTMRDELSVLRETAILFKKEAKKPILMVWLYNPSRVPVAQCAGHQKDMPYQWTHVFNSAAKRQGVVGAGAPFQLLDIYSLSQDCLHWCMSNDWLHIDPIGNQLILQWVANLYRWEIAKPVRHVRPVATVPLDTEPEEFFNATKPRIFG